MSTSSTAAQADPSARVLAGSSAVLRAKLGALVGFVAVGIVSSCLWAGYPVERISQYRRLERVSPTVTQRSRFPPCWGFPSPA